MHGKIGRDEYPGILTKQVWSMKDLLHSKRFRLIKNQE